MGLAPLPQKQIPHCSESGELLCNSFIPDSSKTSFSPHFPNRTAYLRATRYAADMETGDCLTVCFEDITSVSEVKGIIINLRKKNRLNFIWN
ncbi:MAG: hypothetical protein LBT50_04740 [Prevotellaceae bacterium]|nr:hypothetical protein [Prevotellaceae bacterium]